MSSVRFAFVTLGWRVLCRNLARVKAAVIPSVFVTPFSNSKSKMASTSRRSGTRSRRYSSVVASNSSRRNALCRTTLGRDGTVLPRFVFSRSSTTRRRTFGRSAALSRSLCAASRSRRISRRTPSSARGSWLCSLETLAIRSPQSISKPTRKTS